NSQDVMDWLDPPLDNPGNTPDHMISLKPIDFTPDPMRRPYGFRLRNGSNLSRAGTDYGLTFISDNAVVIQGDFNLHSNTGAANNQEEFDDNTVFDKDPADGNEAVGGAFYSAFYDRANVDPEFADAAQDIWRPSEVLGDAIYMLSADAKDGFVEAAYDSRGTAPALGDVSFHNMNRPEPVPDASTLLREDPSDPNSPIYMDRNGRVYDTGGIDITDPAGPNPYERFDRGIGLRVYREDNLPTAADTQINALIISGIVPSRRFQASGGLHNFPRLNEDWRDGGDLKIAGGFFQLFFSHSSTAPYEMEAWEYDDSTETFEGLGYYEPGNRVWGYDVALQYAQTPPIAERFVQVRKPRSEFYRELPVEDPYIKMLRCADNPFGDGLVDPDVTDCTF
ncbi:MAG: hypothetical protein AAGE59_20020, partial [Cyanobacteria bacterium P01_F01_bin.86]